MSKKDNDKLERKVVAAFKKRNYVLITTLYKDAAEAGKAAFEQIKPSHKEYGICAVNVATLFFNACEFDIAKQFAESVLTEKDLSDSARESLLDLIDVINERATRR